MNREIGASPEANLPEVLTQSEAAAFLRVERHQIKKLIDKKGLPFRRVGSVRRFLRRELMAWLHDQEDTQQWR